MTTTYSKQQAAGNSILDTALEYADAGIPVFPVGFNKAPVWRKDANGPNRNGFHLATTDYDEVVRIFTDPSVVRRVGGIGMPTGKVIGATVIDVDCGKGKKSRDDAARWLEQHRKTTLWGAKVVRTASGGYHYYCKYTPGIATAGNVWAKGVDCRNDGGYVVVPPHLGYEVLRDTDPEDWPSPPDAPKALSSRVSEWADTGGETPPEVEELARVMREATGDDEGWHTATLRLTAHLVGAGWSDAEILRFVPQWTVGGYTHRETYEDICVKLAGARAKWAKDFNPKTTDQARIHAFASLWARCSSPARKVIAEMVGEASK